MNQRKLRIGIFGTRGIPASYGGFETFAEELSTCLVARGHEVTVYSRHPFAAGWGAKESAYRQVQVRSLPAPRHKYFETPLSTLFCFLDSLRQNYDVALLCNAANSPFAFIPKIRCVPLVINVDGIERMRSKWNRLGKAWYRLGEMTSVLFGTKLVADAFVIRDYYQEVYGTKCETIAYGATPQPEPAGETLAKFGLKPDSYLLYVSRLEPENNALGTIQAYRKVKTDLPLVIVGDAPYADKYKEKLRTEADQRVIFTGFQFGKAYRELRTHCKLYIQATEVGGTHPALVEAMAYGNCVLANKVPEHLEVLGAAGEYYNKNDFDDLAAKITALLQAPETVMAFRKLAAERAAELYNWERITDQYEALFLSLVKPI